MVSRDALAHVGAVLLAGGLLLVVDRLGVGAGTTRWTAALALLVYGLVLGGSHLYLALRGEDGMVPVAARWRYLAALAVLLGAGAVTLYAGEYTVASVEFGSVASAAVAVTVVGYLVAESVAGYRASRPE